MARQRLQGEHLDCVLKCLILTYFLVYTSRVLQLKDITSEAVHASVQMLQTHLNGLREVEVFSQLYEQVQKASSCLVEPPVVLHQQRAPVRYDEGGQLHPWTKAEDFFQFQFFAVVVLVNAELSHGFEQPTLSLLINIEQLLITAFNNLPNICSIPSKYGDDIDMGRLSTELGLLTSLVSVHTSCSQHKITTVTKVTTVRHYGPTC